MDTYALVLIALSENPPYPPFVKGGDTSLPPFVKGHRGEFSLNLILLPYFVSPFWIRWCPLIVVSCVLLTRLPAPGTPCGLYASIHGNGGHELQNAVNSDR